MDFDWNEESAVRAVARDEAARILRRPYIAKGLDDQGRRPEAAHAATEVGADDDLSCASGVVYAVIASISIWAFAAAVWLALR